MLASSGQELPIRYRRAGLEVESKAGQSCIELQCFMKMYQLPCSFYQAGLCGEVS